MPRRWVENTGAEPKVIGGRWLQKGEGTWVDDGPLSAPAPPVPAFVDRASGALVDQDGQALVSGAGISSADLATTAGIAGAMYQLSDGPNKGAKLTWAIPDGATEPTWCWWLWPQAAYSA